MLDRALEPYVAKGWRVDDNFGCSAVISKEWGPGYLLLGLIGNISKDSKGQPPQKMFKRRSVSVNQYGEVNVKRAPSRSERVSRYGA